MSTNPQTVAQGASGSSLPVGSQLGGGRYLIQADTGLSSFGPTFQATDTSSGNPVSIQVLRPELAADPSRIEAVQRGVAQAAALEHKNVARVLDLTVEGQRTYLVSEYLDGHRLRELLDKRRAAGSAFNPKQVNNISVHLCAAVEACAAIGGHGAVTLDSVFINKAGRVKLSGAGLAALAPALSAELGTSLAPELAAGQPPSPSCDTYGVGAVVYELLTGAAPIKGCKRPSEAVPGLSNLVDQFVAALMNPDPTKRPPVSALAGAAQKALMTPSGEQPRVSAAQLAVQASGTPVRSGAAKRPSLAQSITEPAAAEAPRNTGSHSDALARALASDHERWLITKGKLDYGPFSLAAIVEQIESNQILPGNLLVDNETGTRGNVEDHPLLSDLVDAARQKRDDERRANAEVVHAKQERSRGTFLYVFIAVAIVGLGGGAYKLIKALSADKSSDKVVVSGEDVGTLQAKITFVSDDQVKKRRRRSGKSHHSGAGGTGGSWDDSLDLDMAGASGGTERLDNSQVNPVIQRSGGKLARCLTSTGSHDAFIEFMVKGTGKVYQVRVNNETNTPLAKCIRKAMFSMQFPTFNGVRSKHNFDMSF